MTPASTSWRAPPGGFSSACWNRKRISPPSSSRRPASSFAAPSSIAVCPSCPQACITPGRVEANSRPDSSWIGSASMSARSASTGPGRPPRNRATTLVGVGRSSSSPSNERSVSSTNREVSSSWKESSGCACRCRRQSIACCSSSLETRTMRAFSPSRADNVSPMAGPDAGIVTMDKIVSLCRRRGFVFPSSEIYGGLGSTFDYGHYGVLAKNNIRERWFEAMVQQRDDTVALDSAIILHPRVWEASGHVEGFTDPLVDCRTCKLRFRADKLEDSQCGRKPSKHPGEFKDCDLTDPRQFNLMFETTVGSVQDSGSRAYLRPE